MTISNEATPLPGFGIAGNSAGHLQQTGEIQAFSDAAVDAPRALFPIYIPEVNDSDAYLARSPWSSEQLRLPADKTARVQMEPELALKLAVSYDLQGRVNALATQAVTVINDATWRNAAVEKLAQKKNWGAASKGIASGELPINSFLSGSDIDHFRLCGFHCSAGEWQLCGEDVAVTEYTYFHDELIQWLSQQLRQQQNQGMLHDLQALLKQAGQPDTLLVAIGATRYSPHGEQHQLQPGDQVVTVLYDSRSCQLADIEGVLKKDGKLSALQGEQLIALQQRVLAN